MKCAIPFFAPPPPCCINETEREENGKGRKSGAAVAATDATRSAISLTDPKYIHVL